MSGQNAGNNSFNPLEFIAQQSKNLKAKYEHNMENYERNTGHKNPLASDGAGKDNQMHIQQGSSGNSSK
ncbi:hypothetical protein MBRA1_002807 [Malassezia brasiliensis]|uniref:Uncharacterized protein n=1 Tax=Malassezia brasiliensis TaxID=1821822 RepID=A0AAF0IQK3_9BASI|nr:hypothetical protein MBRA1_002807 [Malassezia brasiliensis]